MGNRYVVVDIETTGNAAKSGEDKITQFAAVVLENGEIIEIFSTFVNPNRPIPPFITELTGIDDTIVQHAPSFRHVAPMMIELLEGSYFVAHNVQFDWGFLQEELVNAGFSPLTCPVIDTVELARMLYPTADSYRLSDLAKQFQLEHEHPHRADSDAMVTAELFLAMYEKLRELPRVTLQSLYELSRIFKSELDALLSAFIMEKMMGGEEERYDVYRNIALKRRSYSVPVRNESAMEYTAYKDALFMEQTWAMERREGQLQMMDEVYDSLENSRFSLIEAGTGTGKTLAYLLPGIVHAKRSENPVVVSTQTIQLQQQIMDKEIPFLKQLLPFSFEAVIMKGRKHYLSLHKFEHVLYEPDANYDSVLTKAKILVWLLETDTGDVDELNLPAGGKILWERICCDRSTRFEKQSVWYSRSFYERAKHRVFFADLIITNHALLLQDMVSEDSLFSSCEYVILDEAHHIEEAASHMLGEQFSCMHLQYILSRLGTLETNDLLFRLYGLMEDESSLFQRIQKWLKELKWESDDLFRIFRSFLFEKNEQKAEAGGKLVYRYDTKLEKGRTWHALSEAAARVLYVSDQLIPLLQQLLEYDWKRSDRAIVMLDEFSGIVSALIAVRASLAALLIDRHQDGVTWMETEPKGTIHSTILYNQPIDVSELLADRFFTRKKSVVLTSATLTVNGTFDYIVKALGLSDFHPSALTVPSPFAYEKQVQMMIPTDLPHIKHVSSGEYALAVAAQLTEIAKVTNGRMLVLFTSYDMLRQTYAAMKGSEQLAEFILLAQGINSGSRARITKQFQQFDKAILFGTNSFWEGIDIPGERLSCLVMTRLPFASPDHPIIAAKTEKMKECGGNAFMDISLPQAILRFKQGFGRLIRTKEDKGVFFLLDRRITTTFYGKQFIASIPKVPIQEKRLDELLAALAEFS